MGQRISFFKNNFNRGIKEVLIEQFSSFRQWYLDADKSSMEEFNEPFGNEILKTYLRKDPDLTADFDGLDNKLLGELISAFIGEYHDMTHQENNFLEFFGPTLSVWRYEKSTKMVLATNDEILIQLWLFLIGGRSLKGDASFENYTNEDKIGYLTKAEYGLLKEKIELHFGDIETIKAKYWTIEEKKKWEQAITQPMNSSYSLSGHNPKSSGLEYVLTAICELNEMNEELITEIEQ